MADAIDVLMMITNKGKPMPAESRTVFGAGKVNDTLAQGFAFGQCCELQSFGYAAGVAAALTANKAEPEPDPDAPPPPKIGPKTKLIREQHAAYDKRRRSEFVDMQPVQYTRILDTASTLLFQALVACDTVDSIAVIKRKAAGLATSGETYLRLDFTKVLITALDWDDADHLMIERGTFIYRELRMRYRPQKADGSLGTTIESTWTMKTTSK